MVITRAKHLSSTNWTHGDTGYFYSGLTSYLSMKVLTFAKGLGTHELPVGFPGKIEQ